LFSTGILLILSQFYTSLTSIVGPVYYVLVSLFIMGTYYLIWKRLHQFKPFFSSNSNYQEKKDTLTIQKEYVHATHNFWTSTILFFFAFVCYFTPTFACKQYRFTNYGMFMHMHAFWHILSAISLYYCVQTVFYIHTK